MERECFKDPTTRKCIINQLGIVIQREMKTMISNSVSSVLQSQDSDVMKSFSWDIILAELTVHAPVLLHILYASTRTRRAKANRNAVVCVCASILLKHRYQKMSLVQRILSVILYSGHTSKQVISLCMIIDLWNYDFTRSTLVCKN